MHRRFVAPWLAAAPLALCGVLAAAPLAAQLAPPSTGGAVALAQELRQLGHYKRVLVIGAHPDDEDTELLTILTRSMGAEAAYLSLDRGEGGQNVIGPELGEALGLLRTEELLAARRLDGAQQYFTRAYDFGFSKTLADTWDHWPRDTVLKDVVRVVRRFRPQVIVSIFSGTPRDGHGQHQAAGRAAIEAFRVAGDSTRFPELATEEHLAAWSPRKLYRSARFDSAATTLTIQGGALDPVVGKSYHQIAMASRSLHRSQDMGQLQTLGPSVVRLALLADSTGAGADALFAGIDTALAALPFVALAADSVRPALVAGLTRVADMVAAINRDPGPSVAARLEAAESLWVRAVRASGAPEAASEVAQRDQRTHFDRAIRIARGIVFDALASDPRVTAGRTVTVHLTGWNGGGDAARLALGMAGGAPANAPGNAVPPGQLTSRDVDVRIPEDAEPTAAPWLEHPLVGAMYAAWNGMGTDETRASIGALDAWGLIGGDPAQGPFALTVAARSREQAVGEVRRPVVVVPRVDVKLAADTLFWPTTTREARHFTVTLTHGVRDSTSGTLELELPAGWRAPAAQRFTLTREDEVRSFDFLVPPPPAGGTGTLMVRAVAVDTRGRRYDAGVEVVDYPHIRPRQFTRPATTVIRTGSLALPRLARVGYVRGAADRVPEALRSVGVPIELLDGAALARGDLSRYDAIVIGSRAYEVVPALTQYNARLLDYARRGGMVLVQYQQHGFFAGGYAPYPMTVGGRPLRLDVVVGQGARENGKSGRDGKGGKGTAVRADSSAGPPVSHDRVTDENAPVVLLQPKARALNVPNRIGPADWRGWVQERGLYFARSWDARYEPLLEMHDPGDAPLEGSLLVAPVGKGTYIYTGLSFFRQLPAGVPGAYRLFANLLALANERR
ncbi:MAG TPA: PIG-L family deacetylase [Gemmatimonadales bacterium]|nr:PIG-L family deacetylase [Gemmatimonadales bacterium]